MEEIRTNMENLRKLAAWAVNTYDADENDVQSQDCADALTKLYELLDEGWQAVEPNLEEPNLSELYGKLEEATLLMEGPLMRLKDTNEYLVQVCGVLPELKMKIIYYGDED